MKQKGEMGVSLCVWRVPICPCTRVHVSTCACLTCTLVIEWVAGHRLSRLLRVQVVVVCVMAMYVCVLGRVTCRNVRVPGAAPLSWAVL